MGRILLSICAVVVAAGLAGASPPQGQAGEQPYQAGQPQQAAAPGTATPKADDPERLYAACRQGQANRNSDLCAQWYAADSAYEASVWTRRTGIFTGLGLIVGAVTMAAAIAAALFAKDAAAHTKRAADTAEGALLDSEKPSILAQRIKVGDLDDTDRVLFTYRLQNYGRGPALIRRYGVMVQLREPEKAPDYDSIKPILQSAYWPLAPNDWFGTRDEDGTLTIAPDQRESILSGQLNMYAIGQVTYADYAGREYCHRFAFIYSAEAKRFIPFADEKGWQNA